MKDFIKGIFLIIVHAFNKKVYGECIFYKMESNNGQIFLSSMPYGSEWLTKRSMIWIIRSNEGRTIASKEGDIIVGDFLTKSNNAIRIN